MRWLIFVSLVTMVSPSWSATVSKQQMALHSFFWPDGNGLKYWSMIRDAGSAVGIAVANPNTGPSTKREDAFTKVIKESHDKGQKVLGYVDTGYFGLRESRKTRSGDGSITAWTKQIKEDVDHYYEYYGSAGLSGIHLDDVLNECGDGNNRVNLYKEIHDYIKSKHPQAFIGMNPGTDLDKCYEPYADVIITFEHDYQTYLSYKPPEWQQNYANGSKFWHIVYEAKGVAELENVIRLSRERNVGYIHVTDDHLPDPYHTLPPYWQDEVSKVTK